MKSLFVIATALLSALPGLSQSIGVADQIRALDKAQRDAALRGETTLEEQYTASDCVSINPAGALSTREQTVARMKSGDVKLDAIDVDQEQVQVYGDTVVVTGREHVRGSYKGHAFDSLTRYSRVWIKQGNSWKLVLFQETPMAQPVQ